MGGCFQYSRTGGDLKHILYSECIFLLLFIKRKETIRPILWHVAIVIYMRLIVQGISGHAAYFTVKFYVFGREGC